MPTNIHRRFPLIFALLVAGWGLAILLVPPERSLGSILRWVFIHASLTQVALLLFVAAAVMALAYLLGVGRLRVWMEITGRVAVALWGLGFLLSMIPARLSWGVWIDLGEPRTQMMLRILAVSIVALLLAAWVASPRFTALTQIVLSLAVLYLNRSTGIIRHPNNPIGESPSSMIPLAYGLVFFFALAASVFLIYWLGSRRLAAAPDPLSQPLAQS